MSARDEIIARLRAVPPYAGVARAAPAYRTAWDAPRDEIIARFIARLEDYHVRVLRARGDGDIAGIAERQLAARGIASLVVPPDLAAAWRPVTPAPIEDTALSHAALDAIGGVMTASFLAIAETGTIVLNGGPGQGRRALSLLPDYHLCVVRAGDVAGLLPEAIAALQGGAEQGAAITFISGPSATADIELDRVEGVHGPRVLDVILVG